MKFSMEDGSIVDTKKAVRSWEENTQWNGNNHISVNTGSQWEHEELFLSSRGRYYIVHTSQWQGSLPSARFTPEEEAARWLVMNEQDLPADLQQFENSLVE